MKKRILSLVLCAAMLLSMCLFLGAGVMDDTTADGSAETTESYIPAVNFTNVAPFGPAVTGVSQLRARSVTPPGLDDSTTGSDNDGLVMSKTAKANPDGSYTITLEAYTTGTVTTEKEDVPTDIVLVLDQSGSMAEAFGNGISVKNADTTKGQQEGYYIYKSGGQYYPMRYNQGKWQYYGYYYGYRWLDFSNLHQDDIIYVSRLGALKDALNNFTAAVRTKALGTDGKHVDHRIAMVGFASDNRDDLNYKYENTELLTTSEVVNYQKAKPTDYENALVSVLDKNGNLNSRISNAVNGLAASGGTAIDLGTEMANNVLEQHKNETGRNKVVIIFTDGVPGIKTDDSDETRNEYANGAIANTLKAKRSATEASDLGYGATVYTVGVFDGANASTPGQLSDATDWDDNGRANRFMHLLSSNYPVAESMSETGTVKSDLNGKSYYLSAGDSKTLNSIFEQISNQISNPSINLGSETVVKDVVTPYFDMPANTSNIKVYTQDATAANGTEWAVREQSPLKPTINDSDSSISVTGFDFNANFVSDKEKPDDTYGKKLIIEFTVKPKAGFLGGNQVPTNGGQSGIYAEGTMIKAFDVPTQDVEVKSITPTADGTWIYLGDSANLQELVHQNATFDGTNNAFVDVTYTVEDEKGTVVGTYTVPAGNSSGTWVWSDAASGGTVAPKQTTTYKVTCTVSPTQVGTQQAVSSEPVPFTITVNTCSLTISKKVTGQNNGQSFVFTVKDTNGNVITTVAVKGRASKTITGLPIGTYTVTEDTQWSWQYDLTSGNGVKKELKANAAEDHATAEFTNAYKGTNWLTSIADVINKWLSADDVQQFPGKN